MANIRVDLDYTISDGCAVAFRSPCDCTEITGLIVYYRDAIGDMVSKEFALADAHGENVGDIPHLFAADVVVKVILDVTSGMAFVQNADTNAYLEGRFKALEEKIKSKGDAVIPTVTAIDFSGFENGSFTEVVDGETVTHNVSFDDAGRPTAIDGISITWGAAE